MSDIAAPPLSRQTEPIVSRLAQLRRQVSLWFWVDGLCRVLWTALAACAADLVIDWFFRLDEAQRLVMLLLIVGLIGSLVIRWLVRPLSAPLSDDALALAVEARHKELGQGMISALQLARIEDVSSRGMSPALVARTVQHGAQAAQRVDFASVLDGREFGRNAALLLGAAVVLSLGIVGIWTNSALAIWFDRNVLLGDSVWPQQTYLVVERVENGRVKFPRGEDWTQVVRIREDSRLVPDEVYIDFRRSRGRQSLAMKKTGPAAFEAVFANVIEPFEFRARGGDAVTDWVHVELVDQPAVADLELVVTPPNYTGESPQPLPKGKGPYFVLKGTSLALRGTANKPLRRAALVIEGKSLPLNLASPTEFAGSITAGDLVPGQYVIDLADAEGLTSRRPTTFGLRLKSDREPRVRARLIGVSGMVVPRARVPLNCRVSDDYAVSGVDVGYQWRDEAAQQTNAGRLELAQAKSALGQREAAFDDAIELEPLSIPTGTSFNVHIAALDNDDVSGPKSGKSSDFLLRVVTEEELRTDLLRREKEQRQEFERLLKQQEELLTDCRAMQAGLTDASLAAEQKDQLMGFARRQKVIGTNVGAIAERLTSIVTEVLNNRIEDPAGRLEKRLREDIIRPMSEIAELAVPDAVQRLDQTRRLAAEAGPRGEALAAAITRQQEIVAAMQEVLRHMVKAEGYQEAVNLLYEIQKSQQDVLDRTVKEKQERIKNIIEGRKE
jgi:hypothetical protein